VPSRPHDSFERLSGVIIVVNTLLPGVLVLVISVASIMLLPGYLKDVGIAAEQMQKSAAIASAVVVAVATNVKAHATKAQNRLNGITEKVGKKKAEVDAARSAIKEGLEDATLPKRYRTALNGAFKTILAPMATVSDLSTDFSGIGVEIEKLNQLKPLFDQLAVDTGKLGAAIKSLAAWRRVLWFALLVVAAWTLLSYSLWVKRRLAYGLALIREGENAGEEKGDALISEKGDALIS